ncbi:MAG: hypothetical protein AMXMBFR64_06620 [Myxococcales bacterium]
MPAFENDETEVTVVGLKYSPYFCAWPEHLLGRNLLHEALAPVGPGRAARSPGRVAVGL